MVIQHTISHPAVPYKDTQPTRSVIKNKGKSSNLLSLMLFHIYHAECFALHLKVKCVSAILQAIYPVPVMVICRTRVVR